MALAATLLASADKGWETSAVATFTTASVSPGANCALVLLASATANDGSGLNGLFADANSGADPTTCVSSGSGPTWTRRAYGNTPPTGGFQSSAAVWTAVVGGTDPGSFTVTVDPYGTGIALSLLGSYAWALYKVTGHDTTTPFAGAVANLHQAGNGAVTVTLAAAPAAGDVTLAISQTNTDAGGSTPGSTFGSSFGTWTQDATSTGAKTMAFVVGRRTGSTSTSVEFSDVNVSAITGYDSAQAAIIVKVSAASTTAVGDTVNPQWATRAKLGDTVNPQWATRAKLGDTVNPQWAVRHLAGGGGPLYEDGDPLTWNGDPLVWNVIDVALLWNVATPTSTAVGKALGVAWSDRAAVSDTVGLLWATRTRLGDTVQAVWYTRTAVSDTLGLPWATRTRLGDTVQAVWHKRAKLGDQVDLRWDVQFTLAPGVATKSLNLSWTTRAVLGDTLNLRWATRTRLGDQTDLRWTVRSVAGDQLVLRWDVESDLVIIPVLILRASLVADGYTAELLPSAWAAAVLQSSASLVGTT
jgi:hypothetical protein